MKCSPQKSKQKGFTLVELLVGVTVFTVIVVGVYNAYTSIFQVVSVSRYKLAAIDLVNEQIEIIRNVPYSQVGVLGSIPSGVLDHDQNIVRDGQTFQVTTTVRNVDDPFDGTIGGTPNDLSPADSKLVEIEIDCALCHRFTPIVVSTTVAPKNLETASTNGALFVRVLDANGNPVANADVHIENNINIPAIVIDDQTNNDGLLAIVDAPPGVNAYEITVTKTGYTTDRTYTANVGNPNPTKPHATVALQQVTSISFTIDLESTIEVSSVTDTCAAVGSVSLNLKGNKTIGLTPTKYLYDSNKVTNASGLLQLLHMQWDSYLFTLIDTTYSLKGMNPLSPLQVNPGSVQSIQLVVGPKNPNTILMTVKDAATGLSLSDATIELSSGGEVIATRVTSKGFLGQTDWSGGSGQATSTDITRYLSSDGNIITDSPVGEAKLRNIFGVYQSDGTLISSTFDTGGISNFSQIIWSPMDQATSTGNDAVRFQIATNDDGGTWVYTGPDGTGATYYTTANQNIHASNNGKRYLRYKMFLHTDSGAVTPNISEVAITYATLCTPPGQVTFSGLPLGSYSATISKVGYNDQVIPITVDSAFMSQEVLLSQ